METTCDQDRLHGPATVAAPIARVTRDCRELARPVHLRLSRDLRAEPIWPLDPTAREREGMVACADEMLGRSAGAAHLMPPRGWNSYRRTMRISPERSSLISIAEDAALLRSNGHACSSAAIAG